jgi:hypothetical protein
LEKGDAAIALCEASHVVDTAAPKFRRKLTP